MPIRLRIDCYRHRLVQSPASHAGRSAGHTENLIIFGQIEILLTVKLAEGGNLTVES